MISKLPDESTVEFNNVAIAKYAPKAIIARIRRRKYKARVFQREFDVRELMLEAREKRGERICVAWEEIMASTLIVIDFAEFAELIVSCFQFLLHLLLLLRIFGVQKFFLHFILPLISVFRF